MCDSESTDSTEEEVEEEVVDEEELVDEYGLTEREKSQFCEAFTILDTDGDGIINPRTVENILVALSREVTKENVDDIMVFATAECDGQAGMDFDGFYRFLASQLVDTNDENRLKEAFRVFGTISRKDDPAPPGITDLAELRRYLKHEGVKLTDEEIDYLWAEENYWMLEEKRIDTEYLINKLLGKHPQFF